MTSSGRDLSRFRNETQPKAQAERLSFRPWVVLSSIIFGSCVISSTKWQRIRGFGVYTPIYLTPHDNLFENGGSRKPPSRNPSDLKIFLPSVWTTYRRFAKFQVSISILTWLKRHLNMAIFAKSYFFCITAPASFGTKLRCLLPLTEASGLGPLPSAATLGCF